MQDFCLSMNFHVFLTLEWTYSDIIYHVLDLTVIYGCLGDILILKSYIKPKLARSKLFIPKYHVAVVWNRLHNTTAYKLSPSPHLILLIY